MADTNSRLDKAALFRETDRNTTLWNGKAILPGLVTLFGLTITNTSLKEAIASIIDAAKAGRRQRIAFANAHVINTSVASPLYARVLAGVDKLYADGSGMAIAARMCGRQLMDNVNGTDMFPPLCEAAAAAGLTIFLLGGRHGVTAAAAETLTARGLGSVVAGTHHGYVKRGGDEESEAIAAINASGASIVLVGMGVPVQDIWIKRNAAKLNAPVIIGVGGLFDFFAGRVSRAPTWFRKHGLEWTWRLAQEPGRMWRRYILGNVMFLARAALHALEILASAPEAKITFVGRLLSAGHAFLRATVTTRAAAMVKRALDILGAITAAVLFSPAILAIVIAIWLDSPGPILFRQKRVGLDGLPFTMIKFRSMRADAEQSYAEMKGEVKDRRQIRFKATHDPRITRVGRVIRRLSLDELPQLWNVLIGEMSMVGPRPGLLSEFEQYSEADRDRLLTKPGITCSWQVSGRANIDFVGQVELDREYVRTQSTLVDLTLIAKTFSTIVAGKGAY